MLKNIKAKVPGVQNIILSGGTNFRKEVAVTKPYKGNRKAPRPVYFDYLRSYLILERGAIISGGCEADDVLGILQDDESTIVTLDKDLDMIPGKHYNFVQDRHYTINRTEAYYNFCKQVLTGDSSDNIPGLKGIGPVKADNILKWAGRDKKRMFTRVWLAYKAAGKDFDYLEEQCKLIWMMREKEKQFELTDEYKEYLRHCFETAGPFGPGSRLNRPVIPKGFKTIEEIVNGKRKQSKTSSPKVRVS
jgi:hypothetical protein